MSKRKTLIFLTTFFFCVVAIAYAGWRFLLKKPMDGLVLYGNVEIRQVELAFRVGGRITEIFVEEGMPVQTGDRLAKLDTDILTQQLDQAKADLSRETANLIRLEKGYRVQEIGQAKASVVSARAAAENSAINLRRISDLKKSNAVSQKDLDNARAQDREARASLHSAEEQLNMLMSGYREEEILAQRAVKDAAQANYEKARIQLSDAVLSAPQSGIILTRAREVGAIVNEGQTVLTLTLVNPVWIRAYISEPELAKIKPGMPVNVLVDAFPNKIYPGKIGFISANAEFTPKTVETREVRTNLVYRIRILVEDGGNVMRQGMPVTILVPNSSLL